MIPISSNTPANAFLDPFASADESDEAQLPEDAAASGTDSVCPASAWGGAMAGFGDLHRGVRAFAYHAPGGGGGGGGAPSASADTTVTQAGLLKAMAGGFVDTRNLGEPLKKALADAGVDASALAKLADKQGRVSPDKLFAFIDKFDANGKGGSFLAETTDASGAKVRTKAGALYEALKSEVDANRTVAKAGSDAAQFARLAAGHGVLDVNHLGAAVTKALAGVVTKAELAAIAGPDGQIKGKKEFAALHALLDKADGRVDGIASGKLKHADGTVGDSASAALLQAIRDDVAANRKQPQYAQPGTVGAAAQDRLTIDENAMTVVVKDQKPVDLKMKGVDQFTLYPGDKDKGGKACFEAAVKACTDYNTKLHGKEAPQLNGPDAAIQVAYAEDTGGRVAIDPTQGRIAREYIDKVLDAGHPAVVGVSYSDQSYNADKMTDHFVTIDKRGYDDEGRLYYEFKDPGAGGRTGRLYVDADTGKLFKQGDHRGPYVQNADYELTQVRTYKGID